MTTLALTHAPIDHKPVTHKPINRNYVDVRASVTYLNRAVEVPANSTTATELVVKVTA